MDWRAVYMACFCITVFGTLLYLKGGWQKYRTLAITLLAVACFVTMLMMAKGYIPTQTH